MSDESIPSTEEVKAMTAPAMSGMSIMPTTFEQLYRYANMIAQSDFAPKDYKGKAANVMLAVQMGQEIGLKPLQAIQNIAVINGRPCVWGDSALALVQASGILEEFSETFDAKTNTATCTVKRKGNPYAISQTFSLDDAKSAGIFDRSPVWKSYPRRMCQMRARGFALRDGFADVLKGLSIAEEAQDIPTVEVAPSIDDMMPTRASARLEQAATPSAIDAPRNDEIPVEQDDPQKDIVNTTFAARQKVLYGLMEQNEVTADELRSWATINLNGKNKISEILASDDYLKAVAWVTGEASA